MRDVHEAHWAAAPDDARPWAWERRRDLLLGELAPGERWLDLGCGAGRFTALAPNAIGVDVAQHALARAARNAPGADLRLMDGDAIPLGHGEVELVWCSEVLEHVPDALGLLHECRRVLRPGGRLLVTTPGHPWLRRVVVAAVAFDRHFDPQGQHVRFFTRRSLRGALLAARFDAPRIEGRSWLVARAARA